MRYCVGTMDDTKLQLTIRGVDPATKQALVSKARDQGLSLNRYALRTLRRSAGIDDSKKRYQSIKAFIGTRCLSTDDQAALDEALAWSDNASNQKQQRETRDAGF